MKSRLTVLFIIIFVERGVSLKKSLIEGELIIAIDFDGTITNNPDIIEGDLQIREDCARVLNKLHEDGVRLILWTCRTGHWLTQAKEFLVKENLIGVFEVINDHISEVYDKYSETSRKVGADIYFDDKGFGCNPDTMWQDLENYVYGEV